MGFLDIPALHHGKQLLDDILKGEVCLFFKGEGKKDLLELMETGKPILNTPFLWNMCQKGNDGKSLRIPVEFIELRNFRYTHYNRVVADITVGPHLIFWRVEIFNKGTMGVSTQRIMDQKLVESINAMLAENKSILETINFVLNTKTDDIESTFIDAVPGIDITKKIPTPVRFY